MPEFAVSTTAPCALRPSRWSSSPQVDSILRSGFRDPGRGWTVIASRKFLATLPRSNVARPSRDSPPGPETKCQKAAAAFDPHASLRSVRMAVLYPRRKKEVKKSTIGGGRSYRRKPGNGCGRSCLAGRTRAWSWCLVVVEPRRRCAVDRRPRPPGPSATPSRGRRLDFPTLRGA